MTTNFKEDDEDSNHGVSEDLTEHETPFSYDEVLEHIGQLGPYQLRTFLALLMPCFFFGLTIMCYTFTAGIPQYRSVCNFSPILRFISRLFIVSYEFVKIEPYLKAFHSTVMAKCNFSTI